MPLLVLGFMVSLSTITHSAELNLSLLSSNNIVTQRQNPLLICGLSKEIVTEQPAVGAKKSPKIYKIFFAQQHVQEPTDPLFRLVGNLAALIKVQVYSDDGQKSPDVVAILSLGNKTHEFTLRGPRTLTKPYEGKPELMPHSYDDSFTGIIPREWIKPGLKVTIELRNYNYLRKNNPLGNPGFEVLDKKTTDKLNVGAPNKLIMTIFDVHFFQEEKNQDFPKGWEIAIADKLPIAEIQVQRVRPVIFDEVVMNPVNGKHAMRVKSMEEFVTRTGCEKFDGESTAARPWMSALKRAGGYNYGHSVYFLALGFVPANGWGCPWSFSGITDLGRMANFWHELGHVFSLDHWGSIKSYPHRGEMFGIKSPRPEKANFPHVGPIWAYSLHRREFISPIIQKEISVGGIPGTWRKDPMQGGGYGDQQTDQMIRYYSDFSVNQMQRCMESKMLFWDDDRKGYYIWNEETKSFSTKVYSDGWNLAPDPFADVVSILISASAVTPEANFIYPVIGPYKAGLLTLFDANSAEDRKKAAAFGFSDKSCDLCIRVTQGGTTATYLLKAKLKPEADPLKYGSYLTTAVNLSAKKGKITRVDLLHTPNVITKGVEPDAKVLYSRNIHSVE